MDIKKINVNAIAHNKADTWFSQALTTVNGSTVRFRHMNNAESQWHSHPESDEFFYVVSGEVCIYTDAAEYLLKPGDMVTIPAGAVHRAKSAAEVTLIVIDNIKK